MTERDIELAKQADRKTYKELIYEGFDIIIELIRADERAALEAELLKLKDGVAASSDYIQGRWDLIGEFQDVIRARGTHD
jgi:hypothetical protein